MLMEIDVIPSMPRILSPNLGCPEMRTPQELSDDGFETLVAVPESLGQPPTDWLLHAVPSFPGQGEGFDLPLEGPDGAVGSRRLEIADDTFPEKLDDLRHTRRVTSTTLRSEIFKGKARFWVFRAKTPKPLPDSHFRRFNGKTLPTLYDLELGNAAQCLYRVPHALCLRAGSKQVHFIHLTDLHLAERNDLWADEVHSIVPPPTKPGWFKRFLKALIWVVKLWNVFLWVYRRLVWGKPPPYESKGFINFNQHMRLFIKWANIEADRGRLDFVLATGDLVDFVEQGITQPLSAPNNWRVLIDILTGAGNEEKRNPPNQGLKVPIFTTTGNHDWRANPYPPEIHAKLLGLRSTRDDQLDYVYRDSSEAVGQRIEKVYRDLMKKGSPILALSWWHSIVSFGLRGGVVLWNRFVSYLKVRANDTRRSVIAALGVSLLAFVATRLGCKLQSPPNTAPAASSLRSLTSTAGFRAMLIAFLVFIVLLAVKVVLGERLGKLLRRLIQGLIGIETGLAGLRDYFLLVNPYFNYAFRLENCYFLALDTGHDCLTAQSFCDHGAKKIGRLSLKDNFVGGSPDTMGFYPPSTYFPYSQIAWLERVLAHIRRREDEQREEEGGKTGEARQYRVFVGLHSPPANLSEDQRRRADRALKASHYKQIRLEKGLGGYDVCYGTVNHYLSQFYYLCLGSREEKPAEPYGCGVDVVLAGHAHWCLELKLEKPGDDRADWKPIVCYGNFAEEVEQDVRPGIPVGPFLLQTAACGPAFYWTKGCQPYPHPPYYRLISVQDDGRVVSLRQRCLAG